MLAQMLRRFKKILHRRGSASILLAGSTLLGGCAALEIEQSKPPVTVSEVIQMTQEGVPADTIVKKMREAKSVYRLNAAELAKLHDRGVADPIINYMQQTYLEAVRREQNVADWNDWAMWGDHFW
jgi:hypothetical protein